MIDVRNFVEDTWIGEKGFFPYGRNACYRTPVAGWCKSGLAGHRGQSERPDPTLDDGPPYRQAVHAGLGGIPTVHRTGWALLRNNDHHDQREASLRGLPRAGTIDAGRVTNSPTSVSVALQRRFVPT